jgi:hypothetical protein
VSAITAQRPALRPVIALLRDAGYEVVDVRAGAKHLKVRLRGADGAVITMHVSFSPADARRQAEATLAQARRNSQARRAKLGAA